MGKYKKWKRLVSVSTAACMAITAASLTGCSGGDSGSSQSGNENAEKKDASGSGESKAMGRYLEEELAVPKGCMEISSLQILEDGSMEMIAQNGDGVLCLYKSADQGADWDEGVTLASIFGLESSNGELFYKTALGKDGSILGGVYVEAKDENGLGIMDYYYCPAGGEGRKLEFENAADGLAWGMKIGANGNLFLQFSGNGIQEINPTDGSIVHEYEKGSSTDYMGVTSEYLIIVSAGEVYYYDVATGKPAEGGDVLTEQLKKTPSNLEFGNSSGTSLMFMDGDEEGTVFYVDSTGLYRYAFGGNVIEQVIDGSLNTISSANKAFEDMVLGPDGKIYIAEIDYNSSTMSGKLYSYTYSADTPTVPDTELTIYSLEDNSSIRQAVAMFQKKYPDIYLTLETGMSGDDGVTRTDALKTLNTEIMAGKGPDILILDGISSETYVEQGMLEDLSGILKAAGLLSNIEEAYKSEDGSIYEMPVKFGVPMIEGKKEDVDAVTDLTSLADVTEKHKEEYGLSTETFCKLPLAYSMYPKAFLEELADDNSAAWVKENGTLDEEKVKEFLEQAGRIYQAGKDGIEELKSAYPQAFDEGQQAEYDRSYGISGETIMLLNGNCSFAVGGVYSPMDFAYVTSMADTDSSLSYGIWNGQAANCFIPVNKIGISSKASQKEAAEKFVQYLFSEEGQTVSQKDGFPVVESVYDGEDYWNQGEEGKVLGSGYRDNSETGQGVEYKIVVPSADKVDALKQLGKTLTTPILDNAIITSAVSEAGVRYLNGEIGLDEAANAVIQQVSLYLAE